MVCITVNWNHLHKNFLQSSEPDIKFYFINLQTTRETLATGFANICWWRSVC